MLNIGCSACRSGFVVFIFVAVSFFVADPLWAVVGSGPFGGDHLLWGGVLVLLLAVCVVLLIISRVLSRKAHKAEDRSQSLERFMLERDRALVGLKLSEEKFRVLFDLAPVGMATTTLDGERFLAANQAIATIWGADDPAEFMDKARPRDCWFEAGRREVLLKRLTSEGHIGGMEVDFLRRDGTRASMLLSAVLASEGDVIQAVLLDLSEIKKAQGDLSKADKFYQDILDAIPNPVFYKTTDGLYRLCNQAFRNMLGLSREEIEGKSVFDLSPPELAAEYHAMDLALLNAKGSAVQRYESQVRSRHDLREAVFFKETVLDGVGDVVGIVGVVTDITATKRQERELSEKQALLRAILDSAHDLVFFKNTEGVYLGCNSSYARHVGRDADEVPGLRDIDFYPQDLASRYREKDMGVLSAMHPESYEMGISFRGRDMTLETVKTPIVTPDGKVLGIVGISRDITDRKAMERELRRAEERYRTIFMNAVEGIFASTPDGRFLDANPAMARLFGYDSAQELMEMVTDIPVQLYEQPGDRKQWLARLEKEVTVDRIECRAMRKDGSRFWLRLSLRGFNGPDGTLERVEGLAADVTARKLFEEELSRRASTDILTGLHNRSRFEQVLEELIAKARRSGVGLGILFLDLDGFKPVNDTYGHQAGDKVLKEVARRIRSRLRDTDAAGRMGGDEFAVVLWGVPTREGLEKVARDVLEAVSGEYDVGGASCSIGASVGASRYPLNGAVAEDLLRLADEAMYDAKASGKNTVRLAEGIVDVPDGPGAGAGPGEGQG